MPGPVSPTQYEISTMRDSSSRSLKSSADIVVSGVDGKSLAKGAWKEGTPSADETDEEQHMNRMSLEMRTIV